MDTRQTIERYFDLLSARAGWETLLAADIEFMRLTTPPKRVAGKRPYLEATRDFYASIACLEVRELIVDGDRACTLTRYQIRSPNGERFDSHVAEFFTVRDGQITALSICFDPSPYRQPQN